METDNLKFEFEVGDFFVNTGVSQSPPIVKILERIINIDGESPRKKYYVNVITEKTNTKRTMDEFMLISDVYEKISKEEAEAIEHDYYRNRIKN